MINANKNSLNIDGSRLDLIFELNHIFDMLINEQPELLIGVMSAWDDRLLDVTFNLTTQQKLKHSIVADLSKDYMNLTEKEDINDEK